MVKLGAPTADVSVPAANAELKVAVQVNKAPALLRVPQLIDERPLTVAAEFAVTPEGN